MVKLFKYLSCNYPIKVRISGKMSSSGSEEERDVGVADAAEHYNDEIDNQETRSSNEGMNTGI